MSDTVGPGPGGLIPASDVVHIIPTAFGTNAWQIWLLVSLYLLTGLFALVEFIRSSIYHRMKVWSFRSLFLALCTVTMLLRCVLDTFSFAPWRLFWLILLDFLLPLYLQFVTFSLLILYLAKALLVIQDRESLIRGRLYPAYFLLLGLLFALLLGFSFVIALDWSAMKLAAYDQSTSVYSGAIFGLLVIFGSFYGWKTHRLLSKIALNTRKRKKLNRFVFLIVMYFVIFLGRTAWNITYSLNINPVQAYINSLNADNKKNSYFMAYLFFYLVVEILPTFAVVVTFRAWLPGMSQDLGSVGHIGPYSRIPSYGVYSSSNGNGNESVNNTAPTSRQILKTY